MFTARGKTIQHGTAFKNPIGVNLNKNTFSPSDSTLRVVCILPLLGHPRHAKRIEMLNQYGFIVSGLAFHREYHKGRLPPCEIDGLGVIENRKYLKRIWTYLKALPKIRKAVSQCDIVYTFGADSALLVLLVQLFNRKPICMEVGDIFKSQLGDGIKGRTIRKLLAFVANKCSLIVVTAPKFLDIYFREWLQTQTNGIVLENKVEGELTESFDRPNFQNQLKGKPLVDRPLTIGYFGLLRDLWPWQVFEELSKHYGDDVRIVFRGIPFECLTDLIERIKPYPNMTYGGEYKSPDDLPALYRDVDLVWVCYDPIGEHDWNKKWARPNRFYESCCFRRPIVSRNGCQDSVDVKKYGIGYVMSETDPARGAEAIMNISADQLEAWQRNMDKLPKHVYAYTDEWQQLGSLMAKTVRKS